MHSNHRPTLAETITFIKKGGAVQDETVLVQHRENLLYMKSVLYLDDKSKEKQLHRLQVVLEAMKKEYSEELTEAALTKDKMDLVASILTANKIIDSGLARLKEGGVDSDPEKKGEIAPHIEMTNVATPKAIEVAQPATNPKLRETLGFLVSMVGDPLRKTSRTSLHLSNLEKIKKLMQGKHQDPKIQKVYENILEILCKIYGSTNHQELSQALGNSIKILKNIKHYELVISDFEKNLKGYLLKAQADRGADVAPSARETQVEKFYAQFKEEKNMMKKINMVKMVLTNSAYKYDKELNAASLILLKDLQAIGVEVEIKYSN